MKDYYVNRTPQANGDNEVHENDCYFLSLAVDKEYLGNYSNCKEAVDKAKLKYPRANGCYFCSKNCHTS